MDADRQRLDRWLWHARVVRTREAAKTLVESGKVRVDRRRETKAGAAVRRGQTLTIVLAARVLVLEIVDFVERRGSAEVAAGTYRDLGPPRGDSRVGAATEPDADDDRPRRKAEIDPAG